MMSLAIKSPNRPLTSLCAGTMFLLGSLSATTATAQFGGRIIQGPGQVIPGNVVQGNALPANWITQMIAPTERVHDFGTVARAAKTEHTFFIKNVTQKPIHLSSIRASCGCTTPTIVTKWIQPGQTGQIHAKFNTGSFTGQKQATLTVSIAQPVFTEIQLTVRGYIRSDVVVNPSEFAFGQVPEGERKVVEATIDYAGRGDWRIEDIRSELPFVKADFEELSRSGGRVKYRVVVGLDDSAPAGAIANQLTLVTNDRRLRTVPVSISGEVQPEIQISPQALALGEIIKGKTIQQRLVVKGQKPFKILDITSNEAEVRYTPTSNAKAAHLINLTISPNSQTDGEVAGQILLKTDLKEDAFQVALTYSLENVSIPTSTTAGK